METSRDKGLSVICRHVYVNLIVVVHGLGRGLDLFLSVVFAVQIVSKPIRKNIQV